MQFLSLKVSAHVKESITKSMGLLLHSFGDEICCCSSGEGNYIDIAGH